MTITVFALFLFAIGVQFSALWCQAGAIEASNAGDSAAMWVGLGLAFALTLATWVLVFFAGRLSL